MPAVDVVFTRRHAPGSILLRTFLWSEWSHVALIDGDEIVEAAAGQGVRVRPLADLLAEASEYEVIAVPARSPRAVLAAARSQVGKPYDWRGVLGIGARRRWQDTDAWFCSELVAWAFARGGSPLVRVDAWRITPRDLYIPIFQPA
ncbi:MAG TPA: YiiX/YebB-like N1pC/P60 family cysteine hydrolase [Lysobacter sp.]|nr:YiiX/YebB-like N1pC/P60 family cysteine hydrolase [Lysobacter sp.]